MPNIVTVTVRVKDDNATKDAEKAGDSAGKGFASKFSSHLGNLGGNAAKGGGLFAGLSSALALAAPLGAAGAAVGAFGAIAIPVLKDTMTAVTNNKTAQVAYNDSVQKAVQAYDRQMAAATNAKQRAAALRQEHTALAAAQLTLEQHTTKLGSSQQALASTMAQLQQTWKQTEAAMAPVVLTVAKLGVGLLSSLMPALQTLATAGAAVLTPLIDDFAALVKSPFFTQFTTVMAQAAKAIGPLLGQAVTQLIKVLMQLFISLMPAGIQILKVLLPLIILMAQDLVPVITMVANLTAKMLTWLQAHHLLLPVLALLAVAILALDAPIAAVVAAIAVLITAGVELSKHWGQIWGDIKNWTMDGVHAVENFFTGLWKDIKSGFDHLAAPIRAAVTLWFDIMKFEWNLIVTVVKVAWSLIWNEIKTALDIISAFFKIWFSVVQLIFKTAWDIIAGIFKVFIAILTGNWTAALNAIKAVTGQVWNNIKSFLSGVWGDIKALGTQVFNNLKNAIAGIWNTIYGATQTTWGNIKRFIGGIPGAIIGVFSTIGKSMYSIGSTIISDLWNGAKSQVNGIVGFFTSFANGIVKVFKTIWGWFSPSRVMYEGGKALMEGLAGGIKDHSKLAIAQAAKTASSIPVAGGGPGPGGPTAAQQYAMKVAALIGWTGAQWNALNYVAMRESGWNMYARNPSSGAYGIAQGITGPSWYYQWPGGNPNTIQGQVTGFFDYIKQRYGNPIAAAQHERSFNWYGNGGWINEPVLGVGLRSGRGYGIGENGPEYVSPGGQGSRGLHIVLELGESFRRVGLTKEQLSDLKYTVRTLGGGSVQKALGY